METVYSSKLDLDYENVTLLTELQYLPIREEGRNVFSNISFIVELLMKCRDYQTIGLTDFILEGYVNSLFLISEMKDEIMDMLEEKYGKGESKVLVERVRDCLEGSGIRGEGESNKYIIFTKKNTNDNISVGGKVGWQKRTISIDCI